PVTVPVEMIAAFFPEGAPLQAPPRHPFPAAPPPPPDVYTIRRRVSFSDIDMAQHVNNAVYLSYAEDAATAVLPQYGWPIERMREHGLAIIVRRHRIEYLQPALLGDEVEISTWVSNMRRASGTRHFMIGRAADHQLLARINTLALSINPITGLPTRPPDQFLSDFAPNIVA
ncbi:MAG TPA: acyl-CoA thioesterase, partial [Anaerolineae bacterium]|nr:acyl-CoA thioesterase [Anaerolineae bacterium]